MILDLDVGNSRIKWLLRTRQGGVFDRGWLSDVRQLAQLESLPKEVSRVRVSSVVGAYNNELGEICRQRWQVDTEFACVVDGAVGLSCGYREPTALGIDRWLAMVAGWSRHHSSFMVVDAGTALTIDLVDSRARHRGGYIIPGYEMMKTSLGQRTWGVAVEDPSLAGTAPGNNTSSAVLNGCLWAQMGAITGVCGNTDAAIILLTGGDAPLLAAHLRIGIPMEVVPDLVFDGLALALP